jgi:pimeloyl-ACP methyl ester carboxylesterase
MPVSPHAPLPWGRWNLLLALLAVLAIGTARWQLQVAERDVMITSTRIGSTPATLYRPVKAGATPVVVIAHGFAGSQQLMQSFALTCARNGYLAVTFDFPGHGRNPAPLTGSITELDGATRTLLAALTDVAAFARGQGDGRLAVLGHSMATDIVVRYAQGHPEVTATIAVSMFSPAVKAGTPADLLVIVGDWEGMLKREALRAVGLATAPALAEPDVTYGDFRNGSARRVSFSPATEHVSVLFSQSSQREALRWLDQAFGTQRIEAPRIDMRGPWILLLLGGLVLLGRPLSALLPRCAPRPLGADLPWRQLWWPLLVPPLATPPLLRIVPTHFLPVLVADYLAVHFAVYGLLTWGCLLVLRRQARAHTGEAGRARTRTATLADRWRLAAATLAAVAFGFLAVVWPIDRYFTSFLPGAARLPLILAMLIGTLAYFLGDEWITRGPRAGRGAYLVSKLALVLSLAFAVALDFERLFFLIIIVPVILLFFLVYGLLSSWAYRSTGHPWVGGVACAMALAWAIGATFPLLAG